MMSCSTTREFGPIPVWTVRSDSNWVFFPLTEPLDSNNIKQARVSFALDQSTGDIEIRPAMRVSNDGTAWDAPVAVGSPTPRDQNGTTWGAAFTNIASTTDTKQLVQFGIQVKNKATTSTLEMGMGSIKLDLLGV